MTGWLQITLPVANHSSDILEQAFFDAGALSVTFTDAADNPVLEPLPGETPLWSDTLVTGLFAEDADESLIRQQLLKYLAQTELPGYRSQRLQEQNWERVWLDDFKPMQFGQRLWICPGEQEPPEPTAANILLDPGLAFGTGTHATTALCLQWLDEADLTGKTVIDYGCGSGILAIAAVKLGASQVWAVDIDPQALLATAQNAERNQVETAIFPIQPDALPVVDADLILANILAAPLLELAPRFAEFSHAGAELVLSGILARQVGEVRAAYESWFDFAEPRQQQEWALLSALRKEPVGLKQS